MLLVRKGTREGQGEHANAFQACTIEFKSADLNVHRPLKKTQLESHSKAMFLSINQQYNFTNSCIITYNRTGTHYCSK